MPWGAAAPGPTRPSKTADRKTRPRRLAQSKRMKVILGIVLALALGFGIGWLVTSRQHAEQASQQTASESDWKTEKAYLEQALAEARKGRPEVRTLTKTVTNTVTNRLSAAELLERLIQLNPNAGEDSRNRILRRIVHHLELLADLGPDALPVIHDFLKQNKDVDYTSDIVNASGQRVSRSGAGSFAIRNLASTDFLVAPSLRLGLVDVLAQIGGEDAQGILAQILDSTGRGVEVAYIARVLQEEAPDKYKENALRAARELLANPPPVTSPNRLDENARAYLYQVLSMYGDSSYAEQAQGHLVSPEGAVDRQALSFVVATMKDKAVPALHAAYTNPQLTNQMERGVILNALLAFTGPNAQANGVFSQLVADESLPFAIRALTIQSLAGGTGRETPSDPKLIQARMDLLRDARGQLKDERLLRSIDDTTARLAQILNPPAPAPAPAPAPTTPPGQ